MKNDKKAFGLNELVETPVKKIDMTKLNKIAKSIKLVLCVSPILMTGIAKAGPEVLGDLPDEVTVEVNGTATNITQTGADNQVSFIDWANFDVAVDESVDFNQPGALAIVVNRILESGSESQILGDITANGTIYLINPNGFLFGVESSVNVGGLVLSTLTLDTPEADFIAGENISFSDGSNAAGITNSGDFSATNGISLLGNFVDNQGGISVTGAGAMLNLVAADAATLTFDNDGLIQFDVSSTSSLDNEFSEDVETAIANTGELNSSGSGGAVFVSVDALNDVYASAVNFDGVVAATDFTVNASGNVVLTNTDGNFDVSRKIEITGNALEFDRLVTDEADDSAIIVTSTGDEQDLVVSSLIANSVTIVADGNISQSNTGVRAATASFTGNDVTLTNVNSVSEQLQVEASGTLTLAAGTTVTDSIELTGKNVVLSGRVNNRNSTADLVATNDNSSITITSSSDSQLSLNNLSAANVVIDSGGDINQEVDTSITSTDLSLSGANVTLDSIDSNLTNLTVDATGNLLLTQSVTVSGDISLSGASISMQGLSASAEDTEDNSINSITLSTTNSEQELSISSVITADSLDVNAAGNVTQTETGIITVDSLTVNGADITFDSINEDVKTLELVGTGAVTVNSDISLVNQADITLTGLTLDIQGVSTSGDITLINTGSDELVLDSTSGATVTINTQGALSQEESASLVADETNITASTVSFLSEGNTLSNLSLNASEASLVNSNTLTFNNVEVSGTLNLNNSGNILQNNSGSLNVGLLALSALNSDIVLNNADNQVEQLSGSANSIQVANTGNLTINDVTADSVTANVTGSLVFTEINSVTVDIAATDSLNVGNGQAENISVNASGGVSQLANTVLTVSGNATFNSENGSVVLTETQNDFSVFNASGSVVSVVDVNSITLGNVSNTTDLTITAGGNIEQITDGSVVVQNMNLDAGDNDVSLLSQTNDFDVVNITANNVAITDADSIELGDVASSTLTVIATGDISQSESSSLTISDVNFAVGTGNVILNGSNNRIIEADVTASDFTLLNQGNLQLAGDLTGDATVNVNGSLTIGDMTANTLNLAAANNISANNLNANNASIIADGIDITTFTGSGTGTISINSSQSIQINSLLGANSSNFEIATSQGGDIDINSINSSGSTISLGGDSSGNILFNDVVASTFNATTTADIIQQNGSMTADTANLTAANLALNSASSGTLVATATANFSAANISADSASISGNSVTVGNLVSSETGGVDIASSGLLEISTMTASVDSNVTLIAGEISLNSLNADGLLTITSDSNVNANSISGGSILLDAEGSVIAEQMNIGNGLLEGNTVNIDNLSVVSGGEVSVIASAELTVGDIETDNNSNILLDSLQGEQITIQAGSSQNGAITVGTANTAANIVIGNLSTGEFSATTSGDISGTAIATVGDLNVTTIGDGSIQFDSIQSQAATIESGNGNVTFEGVTADSIDITSANGSVILGGAVADSLDISSGNSSDVQLGATIVATLNISTSGTVTQTEGITADNLTVASASNVQLNHSANNLDVVSLDNVDVAIITESASVDDAGITLGNVSGADISISTNGTLVMQESASVSAQTMDLRGNKIQLGDITGNDITVMSETTIEAGVLGEQGTSSVTLVAGGDNNFNNDVDPFNANVQTINVNATVAESVTVAITDNTTANIGAASASGGSSQNVDFGFRINTVSLDPLVDFITDGLTTAENLTPQAQAAFGTQRAQADTGTVNVDSDSFDANDTIFRTPDPSIQLPADQEPGDEFDEFSLLNYKKLLNNAKGGVSRESK